MKPPKTLLEEMQVSASTSNLGELQIQMAQLEAETTDKSNAQKGRLLIKPCHWDAVNVYTALHTPHSRITITIDPVYYLLLIQAARSNQVTVIKHILDERKWFLPPDPHRQPCGRCSLTHSNSSSPVGGTSTSRSHTICCIHIYRFSWPAKKNYAGVSSTAQIPTPNIKARTGTCVL